LDELDQFNFKEIRTDILGGIFQRLIAPEERHKFGQHYTNEDLVDVVNAFCIRKADDVVFDPGVRLRQLFGSRLSSQGGFETPARRTKTALRKFTARTFPFSPRIWPRSIWRRATSTRRKIIRALPGATFLKSAPTNPSGNCRAACAASGRLNRFFCRS
jgi:hypothetical protein